MISLNTAGLLVIKNRKLLLAFSRNKKAWYLPGGKTDPGETPLNALIREIREELNIDLEPGSLFFYTHIRAPAFGEQNMMMEQDCFFHDLQKNPRPSAEIEALQYFGIADYSSEPAQVPGVILIMERLKQDGHID